MDEALADVAAAALERLRSRSSSAAMCTQAAAVLARLSANAQACSGIAAAGGIPTLVCCLQDSTAGQQELSAEGVCYVTFTLGNLSCEGPAYQAQVAAAGGIEALLDCLSHHSSETDRQKLPGHWLHQYRATRRIRQPPQPGVPCPCWCSAWAAAARI